MGDADGSSGDVNKTLLRCAALDVAFGPVGFDGVLSWTFEGNLASRAVMERLGMTRDPADDVDHPRLLQWRYIRDV